MSDVLQSYGIEILKRSVGEGGSAIVHKGRVTTNGQRFPQKGEFIAVKEYKESILEIPNQLARIHQESKLGEQIDHPNVVRVYGAHIPKDGKEKCYIFMEWLEGKTLNAWATKLRKNVAWVKLCSVCENILDGLSALHSSSVLHRDIKPENIMVVNETAKLMDIGVAQITDDNEYTLHTSVKDFVGSVRYASPQFIMGEEFDSKDDIYSLGATFLELLSGDPPYKEVKRKPVLPIMITQNPPKVNRLRENVPAVLKILLEGCLHRDRARRPTLDEIRDVLRNDRDSSYIQKEIQRKTSDQRRYKVVKIDKIEGGFYADVGSDNPDLYEEYTVVREDKPVTVPSLNTQVKPEKWIATAELRHVHQSLGYFKLTGKKWVESRNSRSLLDIFDKGHWVDYDKKTAEVRVSDFVLIKNSD